MKAALAHLGERQTEVHLSPALHAISGGTVFDPQKRHFFCFLVSLQQEIIGLVRVVLVLLSLHTNLCGGCNNLKNFVRSPARHSSDLVRITIEINTATPNALMIDAYK